MAPFLEDAPDLDLEDRPRRKARLSDWCDVPGIEDRPDDYQELNDQAS